MKAKGKIKIDKVDITNELEIENPTAEIVAGYLEVIFTDESNVKYSRFLQIDLNNINLVDAISSNDVLSQFVQ